MHAGTWTLNRPSFHMIDSYRDSGFKTCGASLLPVINQWEFRRYEASISWSCQIPGLNLTNRIYQRARTEEEEYAEIEEMPVVEPHYKNFSTSKSPANKILLK